MVNVGVIGCGYWGPNLVRNFVELPEATLLVCCDPREERLRFIQQRYPALDVTTDHRELLARRDLDAVIIATPIATHFPLVKEALLADKHVLVEKPLVLEAAHGEELVRIARERSRVLMVGHTFEYNPAVNKLKDILDDGELGDVYYVYSHRVNLGQVRGDVNALWNLAPHDISILIYLLGAFPTKVACRGKCYLQAGIEDVAFLVMEFPNGEMAHIHVSWLDPSKLRKMTLVGSKKMVVYDDMDSEAKIRIYDKGVSQISGGAGTGEVYGEFHVRLRAGDIFIPKIEMSEPLKNECLHFVSSIENGTQPRSDGESGLRVVKILEAAQQSLRNGGVEVSVDLE